MDTHTISIIVLAVVMILQEFRIHSLNRKVNSLLKITTLLTESSNDQHKVLKQIVDYLTANVSDNTKSSE